MKQLILLLTLTTIFLLACQPRPAGPPPPRPADETVTEAPPTVAEVSPTEPASESNTLDTSEEDDHTHHDSEDSHAESADSDGDDHGHSHDEEIDDHEHDDQVAVATDICNAFIDNTTVSCEDGFITIETNALPNHQMMVGIEQGAWNGQFPVEQPLTGDNAYHIHLSPDLAIEPTIQVMNAAGVAVNGIAIFLPQSPGRAGGADCVIDLGNGECLRDPVAAGEMDECGGHTGRGNDYHYHQLTDHPGCLLDVLEEGAIAGIMLDGYLVYADPIAGSEPAYDCGGYISPDGVYHYAATDGYPYVSNCLMGEFDIAEQPRTPGAEAERGLQHPNGSITDFYTDEEGCLVLAFSDGQTRIFCGDMGNIQSGTAD